MQSRRLFAAALGLIFSATLGATHLVAQNAPSSSTPQLSSAFVGSERCATPSGLVPPQLRLIQNFARGTPVAHRRTPRKDPGEAPDVCFWPKADITSKQEDVRFLRQWTRTNSESGKGGARADARFEGAIGQSMETLEIQRMDLDFQSSARLHHCAPCQLLNL